MQHASALPTFRLERGAAIAQADLYSHAPVTLDSPALAVMTDLTRVKAATIHPSTTLRQAEQHDLPGRAHMLVVEKATAETPHRVRGVISLAQVERQLGVVADVVPIANSFSEIERALA